MRKGASWNSFAASSVTLALVLDWVPAYVGLDPTFFSLLKIVVIPVLVADCLLRPADYLSARATRFGRVFLAGYLIGVGGGVLLGRVPVARFLALAPVTPILIFYLKPRSPEETGRILRLAVLGSVLVAVTLVAGATGVIAASYAEDLASGSRFITGVSFSTLGLYGGFIAASLGGLVFLTRRSRMRAGLVVLCGSNLVLGLVGALVTGQRTAVGVFALAFGVSFVLHARRSGKTGLRAAVALAVLLAAFAWQFRTVLEEVAATTVGRIESIGDDPGVSGAELRWSFYKRFASDLTNRPSFLAAGADDFVSELGDVPHLIVGEAYYDGGLVLMGVVLAGLLASGWNAWRSYWNEAGSPAAYGMHVALWCSFVAFLSLHPGLETRLTYMVFGLLLSQKIGAGSRRCIVRRGSEEGQTG